MRQFYIRHARLISLVHRDSLRLLLMSSSTNLVLVLAVLASRFAPSGSFAQQSTPADHALDSAGPPTPFAAVVKQYFNQWDTNGDGTLTRDEINAAVANPKFNGEAAAAIAAIEMVVRGGKYKLPPIITKD